jgi:hypothetical protein
MMNDAEEGLYQLASEGKSKKTDLDKGMRMGHGNGWEM